MKKLLLIYIISTLLTLWTAYANDCQSAVLGEDWKTIITKDWAFNNILPKEAFEKAVENLQIFCCSQDSLKKNLNYCKDDIDTKKAVPSSAYLFDHILDISIRRLDAKEANENGDDLIYALNPDPSGKEWRNFITKRWNDYKWNVPLEIINEYKKYRLIKWNLLKKWNPNTNTPWSDKDFEGYQNWILWEKYNWVCETSMYIYLNKRSKPDNTKLYNAYTKCKTIVDNRIKNEYDYTNTILMQKWNQLLHSNVKLYIDNYFSQNKITELQNMIFNINTLFAEINKSTPQLINSCS